MAVAGIQAAIKRGKCRSRPGPIERAGGAPAQRIRAPLITAEVIRGFAGFGAVIGAHLDHLEADGAAPLCAQGLGFAAREAIHKPDALEHKRLLERFRGRYRKRAAKGNFRVRAAWSRTNAERFVVGLDNPVGGEEPGCHGQGIIICGPWRQHALVPHLLQGDIHPVVNGILVLWPENLA